MVDNPMHPCLVWGARARWIDNRTSNIPIAFSEQLVCRSRDDSRFRRLQTLSHIDKQAY